MDTDFINYKITPGVMFSMVTIIVKKTVLCIWKLLRENLQIFHLKKIFCSYV